MAYTAAHNQGVIETFWPHFWRARTLSISFYTAMVLLLWALGSKGRFMNR